MTDHHNYQRLTDRNPMYGMFLFVGRFVWVQIKRIDTIQIYEYNTTIRERRTSICLCMMNIRKKLNTSEKTV